jgi:hypothetical protein
MHVIFFLQLEAALWSLRERRSPEEMHDTAAALTRE